MPFNKVSVLLPILALLASLQCIYASGQNAGVQGGRVVSDSALEGSVNAPDFPPGMEWLNTSSPLRIKDFRGKFVLLDFWTFCCINCMQILPDLKRLETEYEQELVVIGVHSAKFSNEKETSQIRKAILRYGIQHPVVNDADFEVWNQYRVNAWPTVVLINPNGKLVGQTMGEGVYEPLNAVLSQAVPYFYEKGQLKRSTQQFALEEASRANTLLAFPGKISSDSVRERLYVTDSNHNRILVIDASGQILDVIGSGVEGAADGSFEEAEFYHPQGTFVSGEALFIADTENHLVRAADLRARTVTTVLGTGEPATSLNATGKGTSVALRSPWDLLVHGEELYVAMAGSHQLWVADLRTWQAAPYAGSAREDIIDGKLLDAALAQPSGITTDGRQLYFADSETSSIRAADLDPAGEVRTLVGKGLFDFGDVDGRLERARLQHPLGVTFRDGLIYVADTYNSKIKVIDPAKGASEVYAGSGKTVLTDGKFRRAAFNEPGGLAWLGDKLYVADTNSHQIRVLDPGLKTVSTLEFTGLEKLSRRRLNDFRGRILDLGEMEIRPEAASLALDVRLPEGYKFSVDAPFFVRWRTDNESGLRFSLQPDQVDFKTVEFPLHVPIARLEGRSSTTIDTIAYYCTEESTACYVDPIRVKLVLKPSAEGPSEVTVDIPVKRPAPLAAG